MINSFKNANQYLEKYGLFHNEQLHGKWPDLIDFCDQCQEWSWILHDWDRENTISWLLDQERKSKEHLNYSFYNWNLDKIERPYD